ncbi:MAG TPA: ABC transporter substrate-binding protein [Chloroflexota bacterium]|nr:ABC transporter substrate-binding protein [Chloroflexota bacterium]
MAPATPGSHRVKTLTVGITSTVRAFGLAGTTTTAGGWMSAGELHSQGLVTSDTSSRTPVGRLAERAPSFDDGSIVVQPDGTMRATYHLRTGVTWQDGAPFTSRDLAFSYQVNTDPGLPFVNRDAMKLVTTTEAPDDQTFVFVFSSPYYLADSLGLRLFWPYPQHLLQDSYDQYVSTKNADDFINQPYFTSGYVNLGPFRLTSFDPGEGLKFEAYENYFLGRPKIDVVYLKTFGDENTLLANLLAGAVDVFMDLAMSPDVGFQLKDQWDKSGQGTVLLTTGYVRMLIPQYRAQFQKEPANLDPTVRQALYVALDRPALSAALQDGHAELAATSILPPEDRNYEAVRDGLKPFAFDPDRAKTLLAEAGWTPGPDGLLRNADGRRFQTSIWSTPGSDKEIAAIADYWRRVGLEVEETIVPAAFTRDNQYRASYPGWETTANYDDSTFGRLKDPSGPETRWAGANRAGYDDSRAVRLVDAYYHSMKPGDQRQAVRAISDFIVAEMPYLVTMFEADNIGMRKGVQAFADFAGGAGAGAPYGSYTRNAYLWDLD